MSSAVKVRLVCKNQRTNSLVEYICELPHDLTPFKSQFLIESHRRFLVSYLDGLMDEDLRTL